MSALPPSPVVPSSRPRWVAPVAIAVVVALIAGGVWYFRSRDDSGSKAPAAETKDGRQGKGGKGGGRGGRFASSGPQPVTASPAARGDINIVQTALGTVNALRTVTVKPRVDGQLQAVLFAEGQLVK